MKQVDLVFRSVGERTRQAALDLAIAHIKPRRVHRLEDVRPFSEAVRRMLTIEHDCEWVVYVDADCLIVDDLRPFLEFNELPFVDASVYDRFRDRAQCGVHITRIDLVREMARVVPSDDAMAYVLRPESHVRRLAMERLRIRKEVKRLPILHDHFQWYRDVFVKIATRELRSRRESDRARLDATAAGWADAPEFVAARRAIEHARRTVPGDAPAEEVAAYIRRLPEVADAEVARLGLPPQGELSDREIAARREEVLDAERRRPKVFGIGLSRTGTHSLTSALDVLGWQTVHYPIDPVTLRDLRAGGERWSLLDHYDGVTDITASAFFRELDRAYPGSRFILTLRDKKAWLESMKVHWGSKSDARLRNRPGGEVHLALRHLLRDRVYRTRRYSRFWLSRAFDRFHREVREHFRGRSADLLELDIVGGGDRWGPLSRFLGVGCPDQGFPHKGKRKPPAKPA